MEDVRKKYQAKMEEQLLQWDARLLSIKSMAEKAGVEAKRELNSSLIELEKLYSKSKQQLASLENATETSWKAGKDEIVDSWNKVGGTFDAIWARVQRKR